MKNHHCFFSWYRRVGHLINSYYLAAPWPFEPTPSEFEQWLRTLPVEERTLYCRLGFTACQSVNAFRRYWLEKRDYRLLDYLNMHLSVEEYQAYRYLYTPLQLHIGQPEQTQRPLKYVMSNP